MAWVVGAVAEGASVSLGASGIHGEGFDSHLTPAARQSYLCINQQVEQFCDEDIIFHFPFTLNCFRKSQNALI